MPTAVPSTRTAPLALTRGRQGPALPPTPGLPVLPARTALRSWPRGRLRHRGVGVEGVPTRAADGRVLERDDALLRSMRRRWPRCRSTPEQPRRRSGRVRRRRARCSLTNRGPGTARQPRQRPRSSRCGGCSSPSIRHVGPTAARPSPTPSGRWLRYEPRRSKHSARSGSAGSSPRRSSSGSPSTGTQEIVDRWADDGSGWPTNGTSRRRRPSPADRRRHRVAHRVHPGRGRREAILARGGKASSSVSKNTDYVVVGEKRRVQG